MDQLADAEGAEGEEADDKEDHDAEVLLHVEERVRVGGAVGDEVLEPEPVERGERGDDGVAAEVGDVPALHEAQVVDGAAQQRQQVDLDVEREGERVLFGEDQLRHEELEAPVHERDDEVEREARGREVHLCAAERPESQRVVAQVEGKVCCGEAEGDVGQELVVSAAGEVVWQDQRSERLERSGRRDHEPCAQEDGVGAAQVSVCCHACCASCWCLAFDSLALDSLCPRVPVSPSCPFS